MQNPSRRKIYCAGPLFNAKEKEEMEEISQALESNGYSTFLPHRDGFEFANLSEVLKEIGKTEGQINSLLNKAIFVLDVFQILDSDGLVLNINGRVPDEGAMVEAGIAWSAGKHLVIYKADARTLLNGNDNPLLLGLADFKTVDEISNIPQAFEKAFSPEPQTLKKKIDASKVEDLYEKGKKLAELASTGKDKEQLCRRMIELLSV